MGIRNPLFFVLIVIAGDIMGRYIFTLPDEKIEALKQLSNDTGIPISRMMRDMVDTLLNNRIPYGVVLSGQIVSGFLMVMR